MALKKLQNFTILSKFTLKNAGILFYEERSTV